MRVVTYQATLFVEYCATTTGVTCGLTSRGVAGCWPRPADRCHIAAGAQRGASWWGWNLYSGVPIRPVDRL